jgi:DNA-directed RNA polymerase subunit E'/Rpb7
MNNSEIFMRVLLNDKIKLEPRYINKNIHKELTYRLKEKLEAKCTRHGYIKKNSIESYKVTPGIIEMASLNGAIQYEIYFHADVCNPMLGTIINAKVMNVNKFGILAESGYTDPESGEFSNILEIIIAKNSVSIVSEINLENVQIGDEVRVEIMGKKYELNDKQITIIGRIVKEKVVNIGGTKHFHNKDEENEEDDEEVEEIKDEDDDEEEEEDDEEEEEEEEDEFIDEGDEGDDEEEEENGKKVGGINLFSDEEEGFGDDEEYDLYNDHEHDEEVDNDHDEILE